MTLVVIHASGVSAAAAVPAQPALMAKPVISPRAIEATLDMSFLLSLRLRRPGTFVINSPVHGSGEVAGLPWLFEELGHAALGKLVAAVDRAGADQGEHRARGP